MKVKVHTHYSMTPLPFRGCDWSAVTDDYEPPQPVGYGIDAAAAVEDLVLQLECETGEEIEVEVILHD